MTNSESRSHLELEYSDFGCSDARNLELSSNSPNFRDLLSASRRTLWDSPKLSSDSRRTVVGHSSDSRGRLSHSRLVGLSNSSRILVRLLSRTPARISRSKSFSEWQAFLNIEKLQSIQKKNNCFKKTYGAKHSSLTKKPQFPKIPKFSNPERFSIF